MTFVPNKSKPSFMSNRCGFIKFDAVEERTVILGVVFNLVFPLNGEDRGLDSNEVIEMATEKI